MLPEALKAEAAAIRKALAAAGWRLRGAARALDLQLSSLQRMLARHPALAEEAARRGAEAPGAKGGRPPLKRRKRAA